MDWYGSWQHFYLTIYVFQKIWEYLNDTSTIVATAVHDFIQYFIVYDETWTHGSFLYMRYHMTVCVRNSNPAAKSILYSFMVPTIFSWRYFFNKPTIFIRAHVVWEWCCGVNNCEQCKCATYVNTCIILKVFKIVQLYAFTDAFFKTLKRVSTGSVSSRQITGQFYLR